MPTDRGRYPPPAVVIPSPLAGCLVPGLPLTQARRSREFMLPSAAHPARRSREFTPPSAAHPGLPFAGDHAAGPPLTQARRPAADSSPVLKSVLLWRSPSCVPVRVCPEGPPECPPPLPGGTVKARDEPFGRGELCQSSVVCVMCSRLMFPYLVCFLSLFHVIIS